MERLTEWNEKEQKFDRISIKTTNQQLIDRLAEYENLEESGRLGKFPYAVSDTVYMISDDNTEIIPFEVAGFNYENGELIVYIACDESMFVVGVSAKNVFATKEAAKAKLKKMEG